jgi:quercetin dioxygenase-like cupin family protein
VQIVSVQNAPEALVTITRVTMQSGATSARHRHPHSEQIWLIEHGTATLLLDGEQTAEIGPGDLIRTNLGEVHGVINTGGEPFYLAVTTPLRTLRARTAGRNSQANAQESRRRRRR